MKTEVGLKSFIMLLTMPLQLCANTWLTLIALYVLLCVAGSPTKAWQVTFGGLCLFVVISVLNKSRSPRCCSHFSNYIVISCTCSALLNLCITPYVLSISREWFVISKVCTFFFKCRVILIFYTSCKATGKGCRHSLNHLFSLHHISV